MLAGVRSAGGPSGRPEIPLDLRFAGPLWHWRGPAPWFFVTVPEPVGDDLRELAADVSYGWGMIPVRARTGASTWETSLFPKDGHYVLPVKTAVRRAEGLAEGDQLEVAMAVVPRGGRPVT